MVLGRLPRFLRRFLREEGGVISVQNLFIFFAAGLASAQAVDVTHMFAARAQLQVAAEVGAHTALYTRNLATAPTDPGEAATAARTRAMAAVEWGMPPTDFGRVVESGDILFGTWNADTETFRVDDASRSAVLVTAGRERIGGNAVPTFLYKLAGQGSMSVARSAVFSTYYNSCAREGIMALTLVDLQSNNAFYRGICLYARVVELNSGNSFEAGTVVAMPDPSIFPDYNQASSFTQNEGLRDALRAGFFDFYILERIKDPAVARLRPGDLVLDRAIASDTVERPSYIDRATVGSEIRLQPGRLTPASFTPGRVHRVACATESNGGTNGSGSGSNRITLEGGTYSRFVLLTNCGIRMDGMVALEEAIVSTTNTASDSIRVPSGSQHGLRLGADDSCNPGGGAQIFTRGGITTAAKFQIYGSQILALGNVRFAAGSGNATNEGEGVSIISAGTVEGTSNMMFTGCPQGTNAVFETVYFRGAW